MELGSIVMFADNIKHRVYPEYFPEARTIGHVLGTNGPGGCVKVQWPVGSTTYDDLWWCALSSLIELSHNMEVDTDD